MPPTCDKNRPFSPYFNYQGLIQQQTILCQPLNPSVASVLCPARIPLRSSKQICKQQSSIPSSIIVVIGHLTTQPAVSRSSSNLGQFGSNPTQKCACYWPLDHHSVTFAKAEKAAWLESGEVQPALHLREIISTSAKCQRAVCDGHSDTFSRFQKAVSGHSSTRHPLNDKRRRRTSHIQNDESKSNNYMGLSPPQTTNRLLLLQQNHGEGETQQESSSFLRCFGVAWMVIAFPSNNKGDHYETVFEGVRYYFSTRSSRRS
ncbi:predicted protein [Histoplasma capsulatum var. duboisii H88]|uniref:Predicted protein n=1 Tax=Ajellomyces capsulatus (strain H88) TaxID=544711 RepID=F0U4P4_AJEC8|nr:predicted protein [Histoplasma capsulatum var. duboisii H88]